MLEGVKGGGGYDAGLAHPATERLTGTPRLPNDLLVSDQQGPHGGAQALGGANRDRVGVLAPLAGRNAGCRLGIKEPRPVEVDVEAQAPRLGGYRGELLEREDLAARDVVGVLQAKELRAGEVDVLGPDRAP